MVYIESGYVESCRDPFDCDYSYHLGDSMVTRYQEVTESHVVAGVRPIAGDTAISTAKEKVVCIT